MLLIAESGSTKTQWRLIRPEGHQTIKTIGFNPFFIDENMVFDHLEQSDFSQIKQEVTNIQFFGSGCSSSDRNQFLEKIFSNYFTNAKTVKVDHDMMAACISLFGSQPGIACIVGTGSNSCVYDGKSITQNVPALGYILGDEASGSYIGKELLKHYIYKTLPKDIEQHIESEFKVDKEDIFESVYKQDLPNRYLASYSKVASQFRDTDFIQEVLNRGFEEFTRYHILCYKECKDLPISAVGSIAKIFRTEWETVLKKHDLTLTNVDSNPIESLVKHFL